MTYYDYFVGSPKWCFPPELQASERWFVLDLKFGLQQPAERRHFHMSDAFSQKILLQSLEKSGKPVLMTNLPDFPYKGFRLVSALGFELVIFSHFHPLFDRFFALLFLVLLFGMVQCMSFTV